MKKTSTAKAAAIKSAKKTSPKTAKRKAPIARTSVNRIGGFAKVKDQKGKKSPLLMGGVALVGVGLLSSYFYFIPTARANKFLDDEFAKRSVFDTSLGTYSDLSTLSMYTDQNISDEDLKKQSDRVVTESMAARDQLNSYIDVLNGYKVMPLTGFLPKVKDAIDIHNNMVAQTDLTVENVEKYLAIHNYFADVSMIDQKYESKMEASEKSFDASETPEDFITAVNNFNTLLDQYNEEVSKLQAPADLIDYSKNMSDIVSAMKAVMTDLKNAVNAQDIDKLESALENIDKTGKDLDNITSKFVEKWNNDFKFSEKFKNIRTSVSNIKM